MAGEDGKCHHRKAAEGIPPLFQHGSIVFQVHHVGWIVSGFFALIACVVSFWLINKHLMWYTNKREQRHIVRILFMVPIYALISFASYIFWNTATPLILVRDGYESIVLASFFYLLLLYVSNDYDEQRLVFLRVGLSKQADREAIEKGEKVKKWCWPLGSLKKKPGDGLYFLQIMKWGILQYSVLRPVTTLAAVILEYAGLYCEISWGPQWGHLYVVIIVSLSVTVAMYCLIQLYLPVAERLKPHKPLLKLFAIKAVVFLTFWQASFLSLLSMLGVVKDGKYMTAEQINIGFGALLQTFEMMIFAFMHVRAFTYRPYRPEHPEVPEKPNNSNTSGSPATDGQSNGRTPRLRSLGHAMNFYETFREIWQGWLYMYDRFRGREPRYDASARRAAHLESALGVSRSNGLVVTVERSVEKRGQSSSEDRRHQSKYRLASVARETSETFSVGVERELERRGLGSRFVPSAPTGLPLSSQQESHDSGPPHRSWWRHIYTRLSQTGQDEDKSSLSPTPSRHGSHSRQHSRAKRQIKDPMFPQQEDEYDDPPPARIPHSYSRLHRYEIGVDQDDLAPLTLYDEHQHRSAHPHQYRNRPVNSNGRYRTTHVLPDEESLGLASHSKDSLLGRVFPPSDVATTVDHLPSTVPHSERSESHNGHSASRWKTPGPSFVPSEVQVRSVEPRYQPQVRDVEKGSQAKVVYYDPDGSVPTRSHIRQHAETQETAPRSPSYPESPSPPSTSSGPRHAPHTAPKSEPTLTKNQVVRSQQRVGPSVRPFASPVIAPPQSAVFIPSRAPRVLTIPAPLSTSPQGSPSDVNHIYASASPLHTQPSSSAGGFRQPPPRSRP